MTFCTTKRVSIIAIIIVTISFATFPCAAEYDNIIAVTAGGCMIFEMIKTISAAE